MLVLRGLFLRSLLTSVKENANERKLTQITL